jgi:hypothetical protein
LSSNAAEARSDAAEKRNGAAHHVTRNSTDRSRDTRQRQKLGLKLRKVRVSDYVINRLVARGYLERLDGDEQAEAMAIEAYLGDTL